MPYFGTDSTWKIVKSYMNALSPSTWTSRKDRPSASKMSLGSQEPYSQVTTTSFYRNHPLATTNPTVHKGRSAAPTISKSPTMMDVLPGTDEHAIPPLINNTPEAKKPHTAMKKNSRAEHNTTCRHVSRQELSDSKTTNVGAITRSWRIWLDDYTTYWYKTRHTPSYLRSAQPASLMPCLAFPNRSIEQLQPPLPTHTRLQLPHLRHSRCGVHCQDLLLFMASSRQRLDV